MTDELADRVRNAILNKTNDSRFPAWEHLSDKAKQSWQVCATDLAVIFEPSKDSDALAFLREVQYVENGCLGCGMRQVSGCADGCRVAEILS